MGIRKLSISSAVLIVFLQLVSAVSFATEFKNANMTFYIKASCGTHELELQVYQGEKSSADLMSVIIDSRNASDEVMKVFEETLVGHRFSSAVVQCAMSDLWILELRRSKNRYGLSNSFDSVVFVFSLEKMESINIISSERREIRGQEQHSPAHGQHGE